MMLLRNNETMPKSECTATNNSYQYTQHIHLYRHYIYTSSLILNAPQRVGSCTYTVTQNPTPQSVLTSTCRKKNLLAMAMKPSMEHNACELQGVSHNKSHSFLQSTSGIIIQVTIPEDFICGLNVMCCLVALFLFQIAISMSISSTNHANGLSVHIPNSTAQHMIHIHRKT